MKLTVNTFVTLDGVMQGPGGPDEDTTGGFERGGWLIPFADEDMGNVVDGWFAEADAILLGRTTYDMMSGYWSEVTEPDNIVATALNGLPKFVASTTLSEPTWNNTTVIEGDIVEAVKKLKERPGRELQVHGSCLLARTLHDAGLVDEYRLLMFPVVVGDGKRLFRDGSVPSSFSVVDTSTTSTGAVSLTLRPAAAPEGSQSFAVVDGKETVISESA